MTTRLTFGLSSAATLCISAHWSRAAPGGVSQRISQSPYLALTILCAAAGRRTEAQRQARQNPRERIPARLAMPLAANAIIPPNCRGGPPAMLSNRRPSPGFAQFLTRRERRPALEFGQDRLSKSRSVKRGTRSVGPPALAALKLARKDARRIDLHQTLCFAGVNDQNRRSRRDQRRSTDRVSGSEN